MARVPLPPAPAIAAALSHERESTGQVQLPSGIALALAAGCLRQGAGTNETNLAGSHLVFPGNRLADRGNDFPGVHLLAISAFELLDDDQPFLAAMIEHAECGA